MLNLCDRRWYHKLVFFYEIVKGLAPSYLQSHLLPDNEGIYNTRSTLRKTIKTSTFRAVFFLTAQKNGTNYMITLGRLNRLKIQKIADKDH